MERIPLHSWEMEFSIQYHVTINSQLNDQNSIRYYIKRYITFLRGETQLLRIPNIKFESHFIQLLFFLDMDYCSHFDPCKKGNCYNNHINNFTCVCHSGWYGPKCEKCKSRGYLEDESLHSRDLVVSCS